jgi:hypothetical protein
MRQGYVLETTSGTQQLDRGTVTQHLLPRRFVEYFDRGYLGWLQGLNRKDKQIEVERTRETTKKRGLNLQHRGDGRNLIAAGVAGLFSVGTGAVLIDVGYQILSRRVALAAINVPAAAAVIVAFGLSTFGLYRILKSGIDSHGWIKHSLQRDD